MQWLGSIGFAYSGWRAVASLARPHRWSILVIVLVAFLATGTDLLAPLIYRDAVNDIAGLFVGKSANGSDLAIDAAEFEAAVPSLNFHAPQKTVREPHGRHHVAPRTAEQTFKTLLWSVILLFAINIFSRLCSLVCDQRTVQLTSRIEADFIHSTFLHVLSLPLRFFAGRASGSLAKQIDQSDEVAPIVTAFAQEIMPAAFTMLGAMIIMFTQNIWLSAVALIALPPYAWLVLLSSKRLETGLARYYEMWDDVSAHVQDTLGAIKTVKLSGAEIREADKLYRLSRKAYNTSIERNRLENHYIFFQTSLSYLSQALVLGYGGWLVSQRAVTPGDVVMFVVYLDRLFDPIESLTSLFVTLQEHFASLARATKLLEVPGEKINGALPHPGPGRVEFRHVHFSYLPGREVLADVSFVLEAGKLTALVGPSGAVKTTAADVLLRLFELDSGAILLDGQELGGLNTAAVRREFGVVETEGAIFRGSIADNLRYRRPEATDEEVRGAADAAGLANALERLPLGLATEVGEGGVGLSAGERQRLQIARALAGQPRVLILDEATANLDYATETAIRNALLRQTSHPTTLVITHRYTMVEICDRAIVLDAGRVIAHGTPGELVRSCPWFAQFAASGVAKAQLVCAEADIASSGLQDGAEHDEGEKAEGSEGIEDTADAEDEMPANF